MSSKDSIISELIDVEMHHADEYFNKVILLLAWLDIAIFIMSLPIFIFMSALYEGMYAALVLTTVTRPPIIIILIMIYYGHSSSKLL